MINNKIYKMSFSKVYPLLILLSESVPVQEVPQADLRDCRNNILQNVI